jgi:hypothetical protein
MTSRPISSWFQADHARLEALLVRAVADASRFDGDAFAEFRAGLLRHIALEEKYLLPRLRAARSGEPLPEARRLRVDHGAIASLLVPTPDAAIVAELRTILGPHDALEEAPGGIYAACDEQLASEAEALLDRVLAYPPVKLAPHNDGPTVCRTAAEAIRRSALQGGAH